MTLDKKAYMKEYLKAYEKTEKRKKYVSEYNKRYRAAHPEYVYRTIKYKYGILREELDRMKKEQDYKCFICGKKNKLCIDHDHKTGRIRKLLCKSCNLMVGAIENNLEVLNEAIAYIKTA